jgi:ferric-dicitrate binding protein FerR (iron transport regulator)
MTTPSDFPRRPSDEELVAYFAGEDSPDAQTRIAMWRTNDPDAFEQAWRAWQLSRGPAYDAKTDAFAARLLERVRAERPREAARRRPWGHTPPWRSATRRHFALTGIVAAVALVGIALVVGRTFGRALPWRVPTKGVEYATRVGQYVTVTLPDSSHVVLAPASRLRVAPGFGDRSRDLSLVGEAYFTVTRRSAIPFVVHTGETTTRVLGTAFSVRRYPTDGSTQVAVETGKVIVMGHTPQRPSVTLAAGYVGTVTDSTATSALTDLAPYTEWRSGHLVFRDIPARDVLAAVGRWYGYQFQLTDSTLATQRVTVRLSTQPSHEDFAVLKAVLDVDMQFVGTRVILRPRTSAAAPAPMDSPRTEVGR